MTVGELNAKTIALLAVLVLGGAGYLWYSQLYAPAVVERDGAAAQLTGIRQQLATTEAELTRLEGEAAGDGADDAGSREAVGKIVVTRTAIPEERQLGEAALVLTSLAERSGVQLDFNETAEDAEGEAAPVADPSLDPAATGAPSASTTATPVALSLTGAGTYREMVTYIQLVESSVADRGGEVFVSGRLFNVASLSIGGEAGEGDGESEGGLEPGPGEILFNLTVNMYVSGELAPVAEDPAAVDAATGEPTDAAAGGDAAGTGAATTDPSGAAPTDASDGSATTPAGTATAPTAGGV